MWVQDTELAAPATDDALFDAGPPAPAKPKGKSSGYADAGPPTMAAPKPTPAPRQDLRTYNDAQIYADYPNALGVVSANNGAWKVPLILGGTKEIPILQLPEVVEFARGITGQDPTLKNFARALGRFYPGTGEIKLRPDQFLDPASATMLVAHEVGHGWSWADDGDIKLGNLGGHIQNIHGFLKTAFPMDGKGELITPKERKDLYNQARNSMPAEDKPGKNDPGRADWDAEIASRYRELIQELMTERKLAYVGPRRGDFAAGAYDPNIREELIGLSEWWKPFDYDAVPEFYIRYRHSASELFADAISVLLNSPADLQKRAPAFWTSLFAHMDSRPALKAKYLDLVSRILKGPEAVLDHRISRDMLNFAKADEIYMALHAEASNRRNALTGLWNDMVDQYWDSLYPITQAVKAAQAQNKFVPSDEDPYRYLVEEHPLSDSLVQQSMADIGRLMQGLDAAGIHRYELDAYLKDTRIAFEKREIVEEVDGIMESVGWEGSAVLANPDGETSQTAQDKLARQAEVLGPEKTELLQATAKQFRDIFHSFIRKAWEKGVLTDDAWQRFDSNDFYATFTALKHIKDFGSAKIVARKGTFSAQARPSMEMMKKMVAIHREAQRNEFRSVMVARVREGMPEMVRDAPMKFNGKAMVPQPPEDLNNWDLITWREKGLLRGVHMQKRLAKAFKIHSPAVEDAILRGLTAGFRESIYNLIIRYNPSFQLGSGPVMDFTRSMKNMPGGVKGRVAFMKGMLREVGGLAKSRDGRRILLETGGSMLGIIKGGFGGSVVGTIGGPPGMIAGGLVGSNLGAVVGFSVGRLAAAIVEHALPMLPDTPTASIDWARGDFGRSALIRDMVENFAVGGPWQYIGRGLTSDPDRAMSELLSKFAQGGAPANPSKIGQAFRSMLNDIELAGQTLQIAPKAVAYRVMTEKLGIPKRRASYWVRNHIALPNVAKRGRHIKGFEAVFPFWNVWTRSMESFYKTAIAGDGETMKRREIWFVLSGLGLLAVLQRLAAEGALGEDLQKALAGVSEYHLSNLPVLPFGTVPTETGPKSAFLSVPVDHEMRLYFSLVSKATKAAYRAATNQPLDTGLGDVVTGFAATAPGLNPWLDIGKAYKDYAMGLMPMDHRNLPLMSKDEQQVGGIAALKPMLGWTLEETGVANFFRYDPRANTFTEAAIKPMPIFGRFFKISDAGIRERIRKQDAADDLLAAKERVNLPNFVQGLRSEFSWLKKLGERRTDLQQERYNELLEWNKASRFAFEQFDTEMELGNRSSARDAIQSFIEESRDYRPAN